MEKLKDEVPEYKYYLQLKGIAGPILNHLSINGVTQEDIIGINHLVSEFKNSNFLSDLLQHDKENKIIGESLLKPRYKYWVLFTQKLMKLKNINSEINRQTEKLNTLILHYDDQKRKKQVIEEQYEKSISMLNYVNLLIFNSIEVAKQINESINSKIICATKFSPIFLNIIIQQDKDKGEKKTDSSYPSLGI